MADVFNGFLLSANLDALFDRFLIGFDENWQLIIAPALAEVDLLPLGIAPEMKLRWVNSLHQSYLALHRRPIAATIVVRCKPIDLKFEERGRRE